MKEEPLEDLGLREKREGGGRGGKTVKDVRSSLADRRQEPMTRPRWDPKDSTSLLVPLDTYTTYTLGLETPFLCRIIAWSILPCASDFLSISRRTRALRLPPSTMISDDDLYRLAIFLGSCAMMMIILYHFLDVNARDEQQPANATKPVKQSKSTTEPAKASSESVAGSLPATGKGR